jgi:hypothetical protein
MKTTLLFMLSALTLAAAHGGTTTDPALIWTIYSGYQVTGTLDSAGTAYVIQPCTPGSSGCISSAVIGDGNGSYVCGQDALTNCGIHFSSSTYDATLGFSTNSSRSIGFNFSAQLAYNPATAQPSWANQTVRGHGFLNISHILFPTTVLGSTIEDDYTTRFTSQLPVSGTYHLRMTSDNPMPDAPEPSYYGTTDYNNPYETALVHVHHCPDTTTGYSSAWCLAGHKESWYVYPDAGPQGPGSTTTPPMTLTALGSTPTNATQVGTLVSEVSKGPTITLTEVGQYSTPFYFKIELK